MHSTEDKSWWVQNYGVPLEEYFISNVAPKISYVNIKINPEKTVNPYAADLLITSTGRLADLKCQQTPFFKALELYKMDPQYTVTFNQKDYIRYLEHYPNITIIFWVRWDKTSYTSNKNDNAKIYTVKPMNGVWSCELSHIVDWVNKKRAPLHTYIRRRDDHEGNARDSYLLDLNLMYFHGYLS
jgi:hypothetical protein